jgi:hypothetical protein
VPQPHRAVRSIAGCLLVMLAAAGGASAHSHRLHQPPGPIHRWSSLAINEGEWYVRPGHLYLRAGRIRAYVYNLGMDPHDLTVADASGRIINAVALTAQNGVTATVGSLTVTLRPGRYKIYCSLYAGTPDSHEAKGMVAYVTVR